MRCPDFAVLEGLVEDMLERQGREKALYVISGPTRRLTGVRLWHRGRSRHRRHLMWCSLQHMPRWAVLARRRAARQWIEREWRRRGPAGRLDLLIRYFG